MICLLLSIFAGIVFQLIGDPQKMVVTCTTASTATLSLFAATIWLSSPTFKWTPSSGPVFGYHVELRVPSSDEWIFYTDVFETHVTLPSLGAGTTFEMRVNPFTVEGYSGPYSLISDIYIAPTLDECPIPIPEPGVNLGLLVGVIMLTILRRWR